MKAFHWLRIAAIVTLLYCAGHTAGAPWTPYTSAEAKSVVETMAKHNFEEQGFKGTYWDLYFGSGAMITVWLLVLGVLLWQAGSLAKADAARVRPMVVTFLLAFLVNAGLSWKYFFVIPVAMSGVIAFCLLMALVVSGRKQAPLPA